MEIADNVILNGNARLLNMLVSSLIENASKYVTDAGNIRITLTNTGKYAVFSIFNTAELEKKVNLKNLFDRFYRPDLSRTSATGGHGIGLSIAKKVTDLHNGSISARQIDDGICFTAEISNTIKIQ